MLSRINKYGTENDIGQVNNRMLFHEGRQSTAPEAREQTKEASVSKRIGERLVLG